MSALPCDLAEVTVSQRLSCQTAVSAGFGLQGRLLSPPRVFKLPESGTLSLVAFSFNSHRGKLIISRIKSNLKPSKTKIKSKSIENDLMPPIIPCHKSVFYARTFPTLHTKFTSAEYPATSAAASVANAVDPRQPPGRRYR